MRAVVQRTQRAHVEVYNKVVGQIADGLLVLLGITHADTKKDADWLVEKILKLRIFSDEAGKMNKSVEDVHGGILVVSQFTLYGNCKKGTRPSFEGAARPEQAEELYNYFVQKCIDSGAHVETGTFGAKMDVELINDGPVTLVIDSPSQEA